MFFLKINKILVKHSPQYIGHQPLVLDILSRVLGIFLGGLPCSMLLHAMFSLLPSWIFILLDIHLKKMFGHIEVILCFMI